MDKKRRAKRVRRNCHTCDQWSPVKREGVCEYLTGYNQQVVYTHPWFWCGKWVHEDKDDDKAKS